MYIIASGITQMRRVGYMKTRLFLDTLTLQVKMFYKFEYSNVMSEI